MITSLAEHNQTKTNQTKTRSLCISGVCLAFALSLSALTQAVEPEPDSSELPTITTNATTTIQLEDGGTIDIGISEAFINFIPEDEAETRTTVESITFAVMQNPELAEVFVPGLFEAPAAGGPVYEENQRAELADKEAAGFDARKAALLETSVAAALLFRQLVEIRVVPQFPLANAANQTYSNYSRP